MLSTPVRLLGFAGLLPQLAALLVCATGANPVLGALAVLSYGLMILSFLGGVWWGFALRATSEQGRLALLAVTPPLAGFALALARLAGMRTDVVIALLGALLIATLLVDRDFAARGLVPPGWMGLRIPLSLGLGALTIACALVSPHAIAIVYSA